MLTYRGGIKNAWKCAYVIYGWSIRSPTSGTDFPYTSWPSLCHRHLCRHLWGHLSRHLHRPGAEYLHRGTPRVASITPCASPPVPQHAQASAILRDLGRGSLCRDVPWGTRKTGMHEFMYLIYKCLSVISTQVNSLWDNCMVFADYFSIYYLQVNLCQKLFFCIN